MERILIILNAPLFRIEGKQQQYVFIRTRSNLLTLTAEPEFEGAVIEYVPV